MKRENPRIERSSFAGCELVSQSFSIGIAATLRVTSAGVVAFSLMKALSAVAGPASALPPSELSEPGKAFKLYQQEKPWVKSVMYRQSNPHNAGQAFVVATGASQPGGYFLRHLTNSPYSTNLLTWGLSPEHEWEYGPQWMSVCYGPGIVWTNRLLSMNIVPLLELQTVLCLGLPRVFKDDFAWTSQTEFRFTNPWGSFLGRLLRFDVRGRPVMLEYQSDREEARFWRKCQIQYEYDSDAELPPSRFVLDLHRKDSREVTTNILDILEVGLAPDPSRGYLLEDFLPADADVRDVFYMSNHVRFSVLPDGNLVKYKYSEPVEAASHPVRYSIICFAFLAVLLPLAFLLRRRGPTKANAARTPLNSTKTKEN